MSETIVCQNKIDLFNAIIEGKDIILGEKCCLVHASETASSRFLINSQKRDDLIERFAKIGKKDAGEYFFSWVNNFRSQYRLDLENGYGHLNGICCDVESGMPRPYITRFVFGERKFEQIKRNREVYFRDFIFYKSENIVLQFVKNQSSIAEVDVLSSVPSDCISTNPALATPLLIEEI